MHAVNDQNAFSSFTTPSPNNEQLKREQLLIHLLEPINIVLVGDEGVGKSSCLITYSELLKKDNAERDMKISSCNNQQYDRGCIPSVVDTVRKEVIINKASLGHCKFVNKGALDQSVEPTHIFENCDGFVMNVNLIDTPSEEDRSTDRIQHYYPHANVFVLMFSIDDITSFEKVADFWCKEVKDISPHSCMIVVGNKSDIVSDKRHVTRLEGLGIQNRIGAKLYMEISATNGNNVSNMIDSCVRLGILGLDTKRAHLLYKQKDHSTPLDRRHHLLPTESLTLNIPPRETSTAAGNTSLPPPKSIATTKSSKMENSPSQSTHSISSRFSKQLSFGTPPAIEKEFRFGVELLPKIYLENDPESEVLKKLNYKIKKVLKVKIDVNMNPLCQLKKHIISAFGKENQKIWSRKTEEQWLKTLKVQILDTGFNDYYDLDDWEQIASQKEGVNIKLLAFY